MNPPHPPQSERVPDWDWPETWHGRASMIRRPGYCTRLTWPQIAPATEHTRRVGTRLDRRQRAAQNMAWTIARFKLNNYRTTLRLAAALSKFDLARLQIGGVAFATRPGTGDGPARTGPATD